MQVYQWIEAQQVVISAALVYHRHANASEILCMTNLGRYGGRIDLEIKLRAFRIPIQRVGNGRVLHIPVHLTGRRSSRRSFLCHWPYHTYLRATKKTLMESISAFCS
jgi:hypothetical protein